VTDAPLRPPPHPSELAEARAAVGEARALGFVARQRRARERVTLIEAFYLRYPCRMGSLHLLAVAAIALARFAGRSEAYDAIGARLVPVDANGAPRTQAWQVYTASFEEDLPPDVREERWLLAHLADMEAVKAEGWVGRFAAEREAHREDPSWRMLEEHMAVTLGARVHDGEALAGSVALETAMAAAFWALARRQVRTGLGLVRTYVFAAARAVILGGPRVPAHLPSDRRLVWRLCTASVRGLSAARVARLGWRRQARRPLVPPGPWSPRCARCSARRSRRCTRTCAPSSLRWTASRCASRFACTTPSGAGRPGRARC
jgi:hypothetical protein